MSNTSPVAAQHGRDECAVEVPRLTLWGRRGNLEHNMNKQRKIGGFTPFFGALWPARRPARGSLGRGGCRWRAGRRACGPAPCMKSSRRIGAPAALPPAWRIRAAGKKPLFWVRPDYEAMEYGALSPTGLLELGGDPRQSASGAHSPMPPTRCRRRPTFWPVRMWARCCWNWKASPNAWIWWPAAGWCWPRKKAASRVDAARRRRCRSPAPR